MKKINLKIIITGGVLTALFLIYMFFFYDSNEVIEDNIIQTPIIETKTVVEEKVFVEIKGAVASPGVYEVDSNSRIIDVVNAAGGLTENANTRYINLSKKVKDEMDIIIYTNEEIDAAKESNIVIIEKECVCPEVKNDACIESNTTNTNQNGLISINTASLDELLTLPGIGEAKAKSIILYREENEFNTIEDIMNVKGIGQALFDTIKEYITI